MFLSGCDPGAQLPTILLTFPISLDMLPTSPCFESPAEIQMCCAPQSHTELYEEEYILDCEVLSLCNGSREKGGRVHGSIAERKNAFLTLHCCSQSLTTACPFR